MEIRSQSAGNRTLYFKGPKNSTRKSPIPFITETEKNHKVFMEPKTPDSQNNP